MGLWSPGLRFESGWGYTFFFLWQRKKKLYQKERDVEAVPKKKRN
ncbi:MAG TPA: hypothetical protein VFF09_02880 [archaeon]|nr:hypothetical protein [archaeon]